MDEDLDLDDLLSDIQDVVNGRIIDMEHASMIYKIVEAVSVLEQSIDRVVENEDELYGFINALSIEQLQKMLENIHTMQSQLDKR